MLEKTENVFARLGAEEVNNFLYPWSVFADEGKLAKMRQVANEFGFQLDVSDKDNKGASVANKKFVCVIGRAEKIREFWDKVRTETEDK